MPSNRDVALVRAGLEAAKQVVRTSIYGASLGIDALDPAAIAATVAESDELTALRDRAAEAEAMEIILEAATEGTEWVYGELPERIAALREELERERMRLAACGVVAMANTPETAVQARTMNEEYVSASCNDVAAAVDREMALRRDAERYRVLREHHLQTGPDSWIRTGDDLDEAVDALLNPPPSP